MYTVEWFPIIYWFAVTAVAIFGTMSSDFLIKNLNWTLWQDTQVWLVAQALIFFTPVEDRGHAQCPQHHNDAPGDRRRFVLGGLHDHQAAGSLVR